MLHIRFRFWQVSIGLSATQDLPLQFEIEKAHLQYSAKILLMAYPGYCEKNKRIGW